MTRTARTAIAILICALSASATAPTLHEASRTVQREQCSAAKRRVLFQKEVKPRHLASIVATSAKTAVESSSQSASSTSSRFVLVVPISLARFVMFCFPLGVIYLVDLWSKTGVIWRLHSGDILGSGNVQAIVALSTYLLLLVSLDLTIKYEAEKGGGRYTTSPLIMVPMAELGKLLVSFAMFAAFRREPSSLTRERGGGGGIPRVALLMLPVALIYNVNNFLVFAVLAHSNLDAYAVWRNVSILFNALLWVWVLQRRLSVHKWIALSLCLLGCCLNSLQLDGRIEFGYAVAGIILSAFLSSLASVFNESVLKARTSTELTLDQVNMILYAETLGLMLLALLSWTAWDGLSTAENIVSHLRNFSSGGLKIVAMQILLGLSVSRVLKFADSVAKTVVGSLRDVVIVFAAPLYVTGTRFDWVTVGSVCWVALSGMIYFTPLTAGAPTPPPGVGEAKEDVEGRRAG